MLLGAEIITRIDALIERGGKLLAQRSHTADYGPNHWVDESLIPEVQAWMTSSANLITLLSLPATYLRDELSRITTNDQLKTGAPWPLLQKTQGLLLSLKEEAVHGLLRKIEDAVVATAFDDFLDHSAAFHKSNKPREAGVLAAIVLEDTIKRIATKNNVDPADRSLEQLVDELTRAQVFTPVKAKRIKVYAGVRNPALHAEWDKFDIRDAGELISGTRELIEVFL